MSTISSSVETDGNYFEEENVSPNKNIPSASCTRHDTASMTWDPKRKPWSFTGSTNKKTFFIQPTVLQEDKTYMKHTGSNINFPMVEYSESLDGDVKIFNSATNKKNFQSDSKKNYPTPFADLANACPTNSKQVSLIGRLISDHAGYNKALKKLREPNKNNPNLTSMMLRSDNKKITIKSKRSFAETSPKVKEYFNYGINTTPSFTSSPPIKTQEDFCYFAEKKCNIEQGLTQNMETKKFTNRNFLNTLRMTKLSNVSMPTKIITSACLNTRNNLNTVFSTIVGARQTKPKSLAFLEGKEINLFGQIKTTTKMKPKLDRITNGSIIRTSTSNETTQKKQLIFPSNRSRSIIATSNPMKTSKKTVLNDEKNLIEMINFFNQPKKPTCVSSKKEKNGLELFSINKTKNEKNKNYYDNTKETRENSSELCSALKKTEKKKTVSNLKTRRALAEISSPTQATKQNKLTSLKSTEERLIKTSISIKTTLKKTLASNLRAKENFSKQLSSTETKLPKIKKKPINTQNNKNEILDIPSLTRVTTILDAKKVSEIPKLAGTTEVNEIKEDFYFKKKDNVTKILYPSISIKKIIKEDFKINENLSNLSSSSDTTNQLQQQSVLTRITNVGKIFSSPHLTEISTKSNLETNKCLPDVLCKANMTRQKESISFSNENKNFTNLKTSIKLPTRKKKKLVLNTADSLSKAFSRKKKTKEKKTKSLSNTKKNVQKTENYPKITEVVTNQDFEIEAKLSKVSYPSMSPQKSSLQNSMIEKNSSSVSSSNDTTKQLQQESVLPRITNAGKTSSSPHLTEISTKSNLETNKCLPDVLCKANMTRQKESISFSNENKNLRNLKTSIKLPTKKKKKLVLNTADSLVKASSKKKKAKEKKTKFLSNTKKNVQEIENYPKITEIVTNQDSDTKKNLLKMAYSSMQTKKTSIQNSMIEENLPSVSSSNDTTKQLQQESVLPRITNVGKISNSPHLTEISTKSNLETNKCLPDVLCKANITRQKESISFSNENKNLRNLKTSIELPTKKKKKLVLNTTDSLIKASSRKKKAKEKKTKSLSNTKKSVQKIINYPKTTEIVTNQDFDTKKDLLKVSYPSMQTRKFSIQNSIIEDNLSRVSSNNDTTKQLQQESVFTEITNLAKMFSSTNPTEIFTKSNLKTTNSLSKVPSEASLTRRKKSISFFDKNHSVENLQTLIKLPKKIKKKSVLNAAETLAKMSNSTKKAKKKKRKSFLITEKSLEKVETYPKTTEIATDQELKTKKNLLKVSRPSMPSKKSFIHDFVVKENLSNVSSSNDTTKQLQPESVFTKITNLAKMFSSTNPTEISTKSKFEITNSLSKVPSEASIMKRKQSISFSDKNHSVADLKTLIKLPKKKKKKSVLNAAESLSKMSNSTKKAKKKKRKSFLITEKSLKKVETYPKTTEIVTDQELKTKKNLLKVSHPPMPSKKSFIHDLVDKENLSNVCSSNDTTKQLQQQSVFTKITNLAKMFSSTNPTEISTKSNLKTTNSLSKVPSEASIMKRKQSISFSDKNHSVADLKTLIKLPKKKKKKSVLNAAESLSKMSNSTKKAKKKKRKSFLITEKSLKKVETYPKTTEIVTDQELKTKKNLLKVSHPPMPSKKSFIHDLVDKENLSNVCSSNDTTKQLQQQSVFTKITNLAKMFSSTNPTEISTKSNLKTTNSLSKVPSEARLTRQKKSISFSDKNHSVADLKTLIKLPKKKKKKSVLNAAESLAKMSDSTKKARKKKRKRLFITEKSLEKVENYPKTTEIATNQDLKTKKNLLKVSRPSMPSKKSFIHDFVVKENLSNVSSSNDTTKQLQPESVFTKIRNLAKMFSSTNPTEISTKSNLKTTNSLSKVPSEASLTKRKQSIAFSDKNHSVADLKPLIKLPKKKKKKSVLNAAETLVKPSNSTKKFKNKKKKSLLNTGKSFEKISTYRKPTNILGNADFQIKKNISKLFRTTEVNKVKENVCFKEGNVTKKRYPSIPTKQSFSGIFNDVSMTSEKKSKSFSNEKESVSKMNILTKIPKKKKKKLVKTVEESLLKKSNSIKKIMKKKTFVNKIKDIEKREKISELFTRNQEIKHTEPEFFMTALGHLTKIFGSTDPTITISDTNLEIRKSLTKAPESPRTIRKEKFVSRLDRTEKFPDLLKSSKTMKTNMPEPLNLYKKTNKKKKFKSNYTKGLKKETELHKKTAECNNVINPELVNSPYDSTKDSVEQKPTETSLYQNILNFFWGESTKIGSSKEASTLKPLTNQYVKHTTNKERLSKNGNKIINKSKSTDLQLPNVVKKKKNLYSTIFGERNLPLKLLKLKKPRRVSFQSVYFSLDNLKQSIIEQNIQLNLFEGKKEEENNQILLKNYRNDYKGKLFGVLLKNLINLALWRMKESCFVLWKDRTFLCFVPHVTRLYTFLRILLLITQRFTQRSFWCFIMSAQIPKEILTYNIVTSSIVYESLLRKKKMLLYSYHHYNVHIINFERLLIKIRKNNLVEAFRKLRSVCQKV